MIGADSLSRFVDWTDRGTCILFGDAAGAVVVQVLFSSLLYVLCLHISFIELLKLSIALIKLSQERSFIATLQTSNDLKDQSLFFHFLAGL